MYIKKEPCVAAQGQILRERLLVYTKMHPLRGAFFLLCYLFTWFTLQRYGIVLTDKSPD